MFKMLLTSFTLSLILSLGSQSFAHGLNMSSASITLRDEIHLLLNVQYDLISVMEKAKILSADKNLLQIVATMPATEFEDKVQQLQILFTQQLVAITDGKTVEGMQFKFPTGAELQSMVRQRLMQSLTSSDHDHDQSLTWLEADVLIHKNAKGLELQFPAALGSVVSTFSRPETIVIQSGKAGASYSRLLR
jgi:hypothetical protein|tara:strand:+ start:2407 stop:2979 length:573 start_codon:yes stop_codon:yes gene_type:complete